MRKPLFFVLLSLVSFVYSQEARKARRNSVGINIEIPIQLGIEYQYRITPKFFTYAQLGFLTEPNTAVILSTLEAIGVDELTSDLIEDAFSSGFIAELGLKYHFKKYYLGVFLQNGTVSGDETSQELVETSLGITLPERRRMKAGSDITLKSNLLQGGILLGRNFIVNSQNSLFVELAISANLASSSSLRSEERDLSVSSGLMDRYLSDTYSTYGYIPSIAFGYRYSF